MEGLILGILIFHIPILEFKVYGNSNLINKIEKANRLYLATSHGIVVLDTNLNIITKIGKEKGLPYPVVLDLFHDNQNNLLWGVSYKNGVFYGDLNTLNFKKYLPRNYLPVFENSKKIVCNNRKIAIIGEGFFGVFNLNNTPTNPNDDSLELLLTPQDFKFHTITTFSDTIFLGTSRGLLITPWDNPLDLRFVPLNLPDSSIYSIYKDQNITLLGTGKGVYLVNTNQCFLCNEPKRISTLYFHQDTIYLDQRPWTKPKRIALNTGSISFLPGFDQIKDVRCFLKINDKLLAGMGFEDDTSLLFEEFNHGAGLKVIVGDSTQDIYFEGPFTQKIKTIKKSSNRIWLHGSQRNISPSFTTRIFYFQDENFYKIPSEERLKGLTFFNIKNDSVWINNFMGGPTDSIALFGVDSSGIIFDSLKTPHNPYVMTITFDNFGNILFSLWFHTLGIYFSQHDSIAIYPAIGEPEIFSILLDSQNRLWLGTTSGLRVLDYSLLLRHNEIREIIADSPNFLATRLITTLKETDDKFLIGTNLGLAIYDKKEKRFYPHGLVNDFVYDIEITPILVLVLTNSSLYFLTKELNLLGRLDPNNSLLPDFPGYTEVNHYLWGARENLEIDPQTGTIWVGTTKGLVKIRIPQEYFMKRREAEILVYPNPLPHNLREINVLYLEGHTPIKILTQRGHLVENWEWETREGGFKIIFRKPIEPGLYIGVAKKGDEVKLFKFLVQ